MGRTLWIAALPLITVGCFNVAITDGAVVCGAADLCPDGLTCAYDGFCYETIPSPPDGSIACDASTPCPGSLSCAYNDLCYQTPPKPPDGTIACDATTPCPGGLSCAYDDLCYQTPPNPPDGTIACDTTTPCPGSLSCAYDGLCYETLPVRDSPFVAAPNTHIVDGLDTGLPETLVLTSRITQEDGFDLESFDAVAADTWTSVAVDLTDPAAAVLTITIDTNGFTAGARSTNINITPTAGVSAGTSVGVAIDLSDWTHIHAGPSTNGCPHLDATGGPVTACDYSGSNALIDAGLFAQAGGQRILLYDDAGSPAIYLGPIEIFADTRVGAAPGIAIDNVVITIDTTATNVEALILLRGNNVHLERFTVLARYNSEHPWSAWLIEGDPSSATSGHLFENIVAHASSPEVMGANSVVQPFELGPDCIVRNCYFFGQFEANVNLANAHRSRIVGNTFVWHQSVEGAPAFEASATQDLTFSNNVVLSMTPSTDAVLNTSAATTGLVMHGNLAEGFATMVGGTPAADADVAGNSLSPLPIESPVRPQFLSDAPDTIEVTDGEGRSLDGVRISAAKALPGAYQVRSTASGARSTVVTVGDTDCGGSPCDFPTSIDNELQHAFWNAWPGSTIEIYPTAAPIAGDTIISWVVNLRGMGAAPTDVILESRGEDQRLVDGKVWTGHDSVLTVMRWVRDGLTIENMEVRAGRNADRAAITLESGDSLGTRPVAWRNLRHIVLGTANTAAAGVETALFLGDKVHVTDSLVSGQFQSCTRFGHRGGGSPRNAPYSTTGRIVNLTCRLTGTGAASPVAAFEVASVTGTILVNIVVEQAVDAPLFIAQRRSLNDTGTTALDIPASFTAAAFSARGYTMEFDGFVAGDGTYTVTIDMVAAIDPLFVSTVDSHLDATAAPIDTGVDPGTLDAALSPGVDLDGIDRQSYVIDRGAYEQGL